MCSIVYPGVCVLMMGISCQDRYLCIVFPHALFIPGVCINDGH